MPLHIDDTARRLALLRLARECPQLLAGPVTARELGAAWHRTGLRTRDLELAIADLRRAGAIVETGSDDDEGPRYRFEASVVEQLARPPEAVPELAAQVIARAELFRASARRRSPHPGHDRRMSDHGVEADALPEPLAEALRPAPRPH